MPKITFIGRVSDGLMLCETYNDMHKDTFELKTLAKKVIRQLQSAPEVCVLETKLKHVLYYKIYEGVCFLTCAETNYPRNLAFGFLDEIINGFQE